MNAECFVDPPCAGAVLTTLIFWQHMIWMWVFCLQLSHSFAPTPPFNMNDIRNKTEERP